MTAKATRELLKRHVGHRTVVSDERTLKCLDCSHTLLLDNGRDVLADTDRTDQLVSDQDSFGRRPCTRCGKPVTHFYADDWEPVPHAHASTGLPCTSPTAPAPPREQSIAVIRQTLADRPRRRP